MHWSKSRHVDYEGCPRRYFYGVIAAPRNPAINELAQKRSAPLVRQEIVRNTIASLLRKELTIKDLPGTLEKAGEILKRIDAARAASEISIVEACVRSFEKTILPAATGDVLYINDGNPIEFVYDDLRIFVLPELVVETGDAIEIYVWRTGAARYRRDRDHWLKAGGLTCYAHVVLKKLDKPIKVNDVYLQPPVQLFRIVHDDDDLKKQAAKKKRKGKLSPYSCVISPKTRRNMCSLLQGLSTRLALITGSTREKSCGGMVSSGRSTRG